jgi:hypothetical protein
MPRLSRMKVGRQYTLRRMLSPVPSSIVIPPPTISLSMEGDKGLVSPLPLDGTLDHPNLADTLGSSPLVFPTSIRPYGGCFSISDMDNLEAENGPSSWEKRKP